MTSGAIQNGVPTDELRLIRMFDSSAETPEGNKIFIDFWHS